jgi:SAM-dependent methyltransferase
MLKTIIRKNLPANILLALKDTLAIFKQKIKNHHLYTQAVIHKNGLEIGGPSPIFRKYLPIYPYAKKIEFVNFSDKTVWEGDLKPEVNYLNNKSGRQHILEGDNLSSFKNGQFDFVLSSNCIEHIANPIKAILEWKRITSKYLIIVIPKKDNNFDKNRPITSFEHLLDDFKSNMGEDDLTHMDEVIKLTDFSKAYFDGSKEDFAERCKENYTHRCIHHHVFDDSLIKKILGYVNLKIIDLDSDQNEWFVLAEKTSKDL